eukprot:scaffold49071_cov59-Phaeocystis_antarctica.AAC.3
MNAHMYVHVHIYIYESPARRGRPPSARLAAGPAPPPSAGYHPYQSATPPRGARLHPLEPPTARPAVRSAVRPRCRPHCRPPRRRPPRHRPPHRPPHRRSGTYRRV